MTGARPRIPLAAPILVGALLRVLLTWDAVDAAPLGDEVTLIRLARLWEEHDIYAGAWPPAFAFVLKVLHGWFGEGWLTAARAVNCLASVLSIGLVMAIADRLGGRRAAIAAGWLSALYLSMATWAALLYTEALFVLLTLGAVLLIVIGLERPLASRRALVAAGVLLGCACMFRAAGVIVLCGLAVGAGAAVAQSNWARRRVALLAGARALLWLVVPALLVISPWALRNAHVTGRSAWLSSTGGGNVAIGWLGVPIRFERVGITDDLVWSAPLGQMRKRLEAPGPALPTPDEIGAGESRSEWAQARVISVVSDHPGWAVRSRLVHMSELWSPLSFTHRALRTGQLDEAAARPWLRRVIAIGGVAVSLAIIGLAVLGLYRANAPPRWWWIFGMLTCAHCAIPILMFGISRFRAPLDPLLVVSAALALTGARSSGRSMARRWSAAGLAAVVTTSLLIATPLVWAVLQVSW